MKHLLSLEAVSRKDAETILENSKVFKAGRGDSQHKPLANQVWALDTTYIPMAKGFVYLTAVVDWASRRVLAAKVAITLEACHAVDVLQEAFSRHGRPEIVNTDQGSQFTAHEFVQAVKNRGCKPSMDGRGAWRDNVLVERLWKSVKYERVYLHAYDSVTEPEHRSCNTWIGTINPGHIRAWKRKHLMKLMP